MRKILIGSLLATVLAGCGDSSVTGGFANNGGGVNPSPPVTPTVSPTVTPTPPPPTILPTFQVNDIAKLPVVAARVYAIPVADVQALATQPITNAAGNYTVAAQTVDEPLEDLINGNYTPAGGGVATYKSGVTDATGKAEITGLPVGVNDKYFIYVKPDVADSLHLPGGSLCRAAVTGASLDHTTTGVNVSTTPTAGAFYAGSSYCLVCHPTKGGFPQTLHRLGIMVPKSPSGLQNLAQFSNPANPSQNFYAGFGYFEGAGTTLYYYAATPTTTALKVLTTPPTVAQLAGGVVLFTIKLTKSPGGVYQATFTNVINPADPSPNNGATKSVTYSYGGGLYKQRYLTKLGNSIYILPIQYNSMGSDTSPDPSGSRNQFVEYNTVSNKWWDATTQVFLSPEVVGKTKSFDINCAACHFNGYNVIKNGSGEYMATGAQDAFGEMNAVTNTQQELNIGCESCHGPGSDHIAQNGRGFAIVNPKYITPEREVMICASCHTRGQANDKDGLHVENPLDQNNKMMRPGSSRAFFLANNVTRHDANVNLGELFLDGKHSKKHHQQATDFIQNKMYRNGSTLMTCTSCHSPHEPGTDRHQLSGTSNNSLCTKCHTTIDVVPHMIAKTGTTMNYPGGPLTTCVDCHGTKMAKSGSGEPQPSRTGPTGTKYYTNDITSHLFDVPSKATIQPVTGDPSMPIPYTNKCGLCHISGI